MKVIAFVLCREAVFGFFSPVSFLTEANLQKAFGFLEEKSCDLVFIAVNHRDEHGRDIMEKYLIEYIKFFDPEMKEKIHISTSPDDYANMIVGYIEQFSGDVCIDILAGAFDRVNMSERINNAADNYVGTLPLIFTKHPDL